ncbi:M61 family metallopeptidase [Mucilaginibacter flavus]|uniref:M61 family metallopeptidase n=1 Tax=Mucilaginibacter flavus TaxID=931504 RepID=UPI0025B42B1C|nr:PDZ domain-containing protein [Mucilaginibacter flavus]MDN3584592.1 PDZ domain-containing protein [Mucilaginibacter flavus]
MKKLSLTFFLACRLMLILILIFCDAIILKAQQLKHGIEFEISMDRPSDHFFHIVLNYKNPPKEVVDFNMPTWTPGFYEIVDFAGAVQNFSAIGCNGKKLSWSKASSNTWEVKNPKKQPIKITYDVRAIEPFIGNINLDDHYGYIIPGAVCSYSAGELKTPVTIEVKPYSKWPPFVATSLDTVLGKSNTFYAADFDVLYDSPFLMGELEKFPSFMLKGKPVGFIGYNLGNFDRKAFMTDLSKIVISGSNIIGDIPYSHYSFLAVGINGGDYGGIEHLNSVSIIMNTNGLLSPRRKNAFYAFLAHEYFHLYNVKRIRPIALGPFDYSKENYTNLLWVSEGFTDYYEYLILNRAGLMKKDGVLANYQEHISNYENKPGHLFQTANQANQGIWAIRGNPNARTSDEIDKTISVYDKGCAIGLMLDLEIRHDTHNKVSLDDVMKILYKDYYKRLKRGFTDQEFRRACEKAAGKSLSEIFGYSSTVKPINYPKYLAYAGLQIDTVTKTLPGGYLGAFLGMRDSTLLVGSVDNHSPAMNAGLQPGDKILMVDGVKADLQSYKTYMLTKKKGDTLNLKIERDSLEKNLTALIEIKREKSFAITGAEHPDDLARQIYKSWLLP